MRLGFDAPSVEAIEEMRRELWQHRLPELVRRPTLTPAEREYAPYFGEPVFPHPDWGDGGSDLGIGDGVDRVAVATAVAFMMRNNVREDRIGKHPVEEKLERAFSEIKLPDETREIIVDEMDYFNTANSWNRFSEDSRLYVTYFHLARVGLLGLSAANFLGLSEDMKRDLFVAGTLHDIGKAWIFHPRNRDKNYRDFQDEMHNHPSYSVRDLLSKGRFLGERVLGTIERHHCFQADPYPSDFMTNETPEAIYLAQLLSAVDSYDSASTRANNRHRVPLLWRFVGSGLPSGRRVRNLMLAEKGRIPIGYEGARHRTMGELIEDLYDNRVIGKGDPFNPEVTI